MEGIFYPAQPEALSTEIAALLAGAPCAPAQPAELVYGLIAPHASLGYAGTVSAAAYACVASRRPAVAVLLGPTHRDAPDAVVLPESAYFRTPLGTVPVDRQLLRQLQEPAAGASCFRVDDIPHLEEHCLEVQLPFLQHLFPSIGIVPLLVGRLSMRLVESLADALWRTFSGSLPETLFVVTTNLGSQHAQRTERAERAERASALLHARFIQRVLQADWRAVAGEAVRGRSCSCGAAAVAAILHLHERRGGPVRLLQKGSSPETGAEAGQRVHYAAFSLAESTQ